MSVPLWRGASLAAALVCSAPAMAVQPAPMVYQSIGEVAARLAAPPDDARPLVRWWWFGPAVVKAELDREMAAMKSGGFGGFEIQPVYPMELDDPARGIKNVPYLSREFLDTVSYVNRRARAQKLRVDITLASGWPYGGPHIGVTRSAGRLRVAVTELPANSTSFALPAVMSGETIIASFVGQGSSKQVDQASLRMLDGASDHGRMAIGPAGTTRVVVTYLASRTGQQVKRAALGAEGFVLDHLSADAVNYHLATVATPLLKAFGDHPPYAVFSDSLEVYGTDWTDDFLAQFQQRRGYDLRPHLPAIVGGEGAQAAAMRRDWVLTQTELANERYLTPVDNWARAHGTQFRSQTYGEPAVSLSSNRLVALPEGEGPQFRTFSFTRLATSAGHLYGRPVISAETWTWLNSPAFSATPLDMKAEADRMLLQGVNQFVGHGWPYTPPGTLEPGYQFYAAGVFNDHNPWWNVMPEVTSYLTRMSYLMRQGQPANDVAVFLPNDDVASRLVPGKVSLSAEMHRYVTPELIEQVLDAGFNLDYVDAESVLALGVKHPVLVLPHVERLAPEVIARLSAYVRAGGKVIAVGSKPSVAPGYADAARISADVLKASDALFAAGATLVADDAAVGGAIGAVLKPDLQLSAQATDVGFVHRKLADADIYFIANTSNRDARAVATFRNPRAHASWLDPYTGALTQAPLSPELTLAPYESRVLVFTDKPLVSKPAQALSAPRVLADLGANWRISFGKAPAQPMAQLASWTDDPSTRYFSGVATYTKQVTISAEQLKDSRITLDFGPGTALASTPAVPAGMRAMLDSPVREAAQVVINGQRSGAIWHPPYTLDVTQLLHSGSNHIEIRVANLGLNALAGHALPDYRLLTARYGQRFVPQDTDLIIPRPSGIVGPVRLMAQSVL